MGKKFAIFLLVCVLGAGIGLWAWSLFKKEIQPVAEIIEQLPDDLNVDVSAKQVTLSQGEDGKELWTLTAKSASYDQDSGRAGLVEPVIDYAADDQAVHITAPDGTVDQTQNTMTLTNGVVANYGAVDITGQRLDYNGTAHQIVISGDALVRRQGLTIKAPKFVFNLKTGELLALDGVRLDAQEGVDDAGKEKSQ
jgi:LPS export ABC transporter protein LptC